MASFQARGNSFVKMAAIGKVDESSEINEKILRECFKLYTDKTNGLIAVGKHFNVDITPPSKQIVVLLLGNHSAGKSTFINWYVGENVQKAGVAVETQGFTFVQHGRRRETLLAEAAMLTMPRFQELAGLEGILDFVTMEISSSTQRRFNLVTFIDSPGLVDGGLKYPYDVDKALPLLGNLADLIFVFFDPIGQALCHRTLEIIRQISNNRNDGIFFFLSKVDEAGNHADRQKVMIQIVQELCSTAGFNRQGFEIKSIHIPGMARETGCLNQIEEACGEIERAVSFTVQKTLNKLGSDCQMLHKKISQASLSNKITFYYSSLFCLSLSILTAAIVGIESFQDTWDMRNFIGWPFWVFNSITSLIFFILFLHISNCKSAFHWNSRLTLSRINNIVTKAKMKKDILYLEYLGQSIPQ